jgi:DNA-binding PadR family transcriptional regulator
MDAPALASPIDVAVLAMLEAGPLHPYGLQRRIRRWGKDAALNVAQRGNLYKAVRRLHAAGLVEIRDTERGGRFPERTPYALTDAGRRAGREWLTGLLATPQAEYPSFPAALSLAMLLGPGQVLAALERRAEAVRERLAAAPPGEIAELPRVARIEREYQRAVLLAELSWVEGVVGELRSGTLSWSRYDASSA